MLKISYAPRFVRMYKQLEPALKEEVKLKIDLFRNTRSHNAFKVHKLHGKLKGHFAFSVNYKIRITFRYETKSFISFLTVGPHDQVYK